MMMKLTCDLINVLQGKTLSVAESCTGGMIGAALTAVPGSSAVFKGGIISYTNEVKKKMLSVPGEMLDREGAVSAAVACAMAEGARENLSTDYAISVTGLAGPGGDEFGNPVGTVFVGYADHNGAKFRTFCFVGDRQQVREQAATAALEFLYEEITNFGG